MDTLTLSTRAMTNVGHMNGCSYKASIDPRFPGAAGIHGGLVTMTLNYFSVLFYAASAAQAAAELQKDSPESRRLYATANILFAVAAKALKADFRGNLVSAHLFFSPDNNFRHFDILRLRTSNGKSGDELALVNASIPWPQLSEQARLFFFENCQLIERAEDGWEGEDWTNEGLLATTEPAYYLDMLCAVDRENLWLYEVVAAVYEMLDEKYAMEAMELIRSHFGRFRSGVASLLSW